MIYYLSEDQLGFPPPHFADEDTGILAVGGDLSVDRLLLAYSTGIFPWYDEDATPILWHAPAQRMVLTPSGVHIGRTLRKWIKKKQYAITYDLAFPDVLKHCANTPRPDQAGTWLNQSLQEALCTLHSLGYAHSVEAWLNGELVGGLYGLTIGGVFFGESMFSLADNASKVAFVTLCKALNQFGYALIDCQVHTPYLESLGGFEVDRELFTALLADGVQTIPRSVWPMTNQEY